MTWALSHRHAGRHTTRMPGTATGTVRWPRGLALIGMLSLLVAAWGGIVPFVGPTFGYSANGSPSWQWSNMHGWLYVLPGAVGVAASLLVLSRPRTGRVGTRMSLALLGLIMAACGAWFVLGPSAWPIVGSGAVFASGQSAMDHFLYGLGYNYGVGIVLVALGAMVINAGIAEREVPVTVGNADVPAYTPAEAATVPAAGAAAAPAAGGRLSWRERRAERRAARRAERAGGAPGAATAAGGGAPAAERTGGETTTAERTTGETPAQTAVDRDAEDSFPASDAPSPFRGNPS